MTNTSGDRTRQWVNLLRKFPQAYREDEEIVRWIADRRIGPLIALLDADRKEAREELSGLRRRYPKEFARAQRENRGEYEWDGEDEDESEELTDRQWEQRQRRRDRQEAEYGWVNQQYRTHVHILQDRSLLIDRIRELEAFEAEDTS